MRKLTLSLALALGTSPAAQSSLIASEEVSQATFEIDPVTGSTTPLGSIGLRLVTDLAWNPRTKVLYAVRSHPNQLLTIDVATGTPTIIGTFGTGFINMHGLAYNPNNDKLYGISTITSQVYLLDPQSGGGTVIGKHALVFPSGLAYDHVRDTMYATDWGKSLHTIDLKTGRSTRVGALGASSTLGSALAFHPAMGLLAIDNNGSGSNRNDLYRINSTTGQATWIAHLPRGNMLGLEFVDGACLPARARTYGSGFAGTSGIPTLSAPPAVQGKPIRLHLSNSLGLSTHGWIVVNLQRASAPAFWGGTLHVSLTNSIILSAAIPPAGAYLSWQVPATAPCGHSVFLQGVVCDPGAPVGLSSSAGLELRIGKM